MAHVKLSWAPFKDSLEHDAICYYSGSDTTVKKVAWASPTGWLFYEFNPVADRATFEAWVASLRPQATLALVFVEDIAF